jgi:pantoate--beta-alanine ligase
MRLSSTAHDLRRWVAGWREEGAVIGFVPTMGNLHEGHAALVRRAQALCDRVIVSVFVNPTQFGPGEDFATYPRTPEDDEKLLARLGTDLLFRPEAEEIYPFGIEAAVRVSVPGLSGILCGAARPGHFDGVAGVVLRLFTITQADRAFFGEKDYQQYLLVRRLVDDLRLPLEIVPVGTVRESDGLALSSRNRYLTPSERLRAPRLAAVLRRLRAAVAQGARDWAALEAEAARELEADGFRVDYVAVRRALDLAPPGPSDRPEDLRLLAAARLGRTRLIDNMPAAGDEAAR